MLLSNNGCAGAASRPIEPRRSCRRSLALVPPAPLQVCRRAVTRMAVAAPAGDALGRNHKLSAIEITGAKKRIQVEVSEIAADTHAIRALDWDRDRFDIEFGLQEGTTYNSYVIQGDKLAVVDASKDNFRDLYLAALKGLIDPAKIDYIIVSHTEPDHSGLIPDLLALAPNATLVGTKVALQFLSNLVHTKFKTMVAGADATLDLGKGHMLQFIMAPNLHWPDTMFTYDAGTSTIFTCDAFGMHYCTGTTFDADLAAIMPHFRFYYDCLMKPNSRSVLAALKRLKDLQFTTIATGHGPVLRYNVGELMGNYKTWSESSAKAAESVAVFYPNDYGFSDRLSQSLARGITKTGVGVEMHNLTTVDPHELGEIMGRSSGIVLLAPPTGSEAARVVGNLLASTNKKQKVLIAESYGGSDEPVDTLADGFVKASVELAVPPLRVKAVPTAATYQEFEETGTDLGQLLIKKTVMARQKAAMSPEVAKALARVSAGLYVVTATQGSAKSAMIASWVSQASFEPLGVTIAVAKDRAIESYMQVNDTFVLNCLEEGKYAGLMKHFLKRFPPGADRFEGVSWRSANNGSPVLLDAAAYMECKVRSRMEGPDHWIVYSEVVDGAVANADARTAVHSRKVANYY